MIKIDRMALADCFSPLELVEWIFKNNPQLKAPIPVEEIAIASGIIEILEVPSLENTPVVGMLVALGDKDHGVIQLQPCKNVGRKRFTIGHELGHLLISHHSARAIDLNKQRSQRGLTPEEEAENRIIEGEANTFSTELLLPLHLIKPILKAPPTIIKGVGIADIFQMSVQATLKRLISAKMWPATIIAFLHEDNSIQFHIASEDELYDAFLFRKKDKCGQKLVLSPRCGHSITQIVSSSKWLKEGFASELSIKEETYKYADSNYQIIALTLLL